jgi:putative phosphoribosyl transferase
MTKRVIIPADSLQLEGDLAIPQNATGVVLFAHGSGSSRLSPRNQFVAEALQHIGIGTLLFDLLT